MISLFQRFIRSCMITCVGMVGLIGAASLSATPLGTEYLLVFDGQLADGNNFDVEGHSGFFIFDNVEEILMNDQVPSLPFSPGIDLLVNEAAVINSDGSEAISIVIFSEDGSPLFTNFEFLTAVDLIIEQLFWTQGAATILGFELLLSQTPIEPLFFDFSGAGDANDPLTLLFNLDPFQFDDSTSELELILTVSHVPEPVSLLLFGVGGVGLLVQRRQYRKPA